MYLGEGKRPTSEHLLKLVQKYGLKNGKKIIDEVFEATNRWSEFAMVASVSQKTIRTIDEYMRDF